ncbi:hypothetical protein IJO12_07720 [bacterium]|nr:hypothetical protein [bacterium]
MIIKKNKQRHNKITEQEILVSDSQVSSDANIVATEQNATPLQVSEETVVSNESEGQEEDNSELFNIEEIDFTERQERRRGTRRRGYRRIDDRNLISRAMEESENIKKSAFEEGYRLGLENAKTDVENFKNEFQKFMSARKDVFEYIAPDILEISVNIAKKIIKKELNTDPQVLINTIIDVLKTVAKSESKVTIKVNPQSVQFIKDTIPNIAYEYGIEAKVNILADPSIEIGGCIFQTNNGIVDASIDTQLEIIKKALEGI